MNQISQESYIEEDEIDLKELFSTIWNNKFKIVFFTFIVTSLTIIYTLSIPNSYKSSTILVPQGQSKSSLGGLGALAGMAGIDISGGSELSVSASFNTILNNFTFQKYIINKYNLSEQLITKQENLVFALGYDSIYNLLNSKNENEIDPKSKEEIEYDTFESLKNILNVSEDKKSGIITLSAEYTDRFLTKKLVDIYLIEITSHLRKLEMNNVNKQIEYYNKEIQITQDINIQQQLSQLVSGLVQKKVLSKANTFYNVKQLTKPQVSFIKEKTKPKRGLIVVVSFVTSIILGIFMIFFIEFLRKEPKN